MSRYDDLDQLKNLYNLKNSYQEDIEMGNDSTENLFLLKNIEKQISFMRMKLGLVQESVKIYDLAAEAFEIQNAGWKPDKEYQKTEEFRNISKSIFISGYIAASNNNDIIKDKEMKPKIMALLQRDYSLNLQFVSTDNTFLHMVYSEIVKKNFNVSKCLNKQIISELGEEYSDDLYYLVDETILEFKQDLLKKIKTLD